MAHASFVSCKTGIYHLCHFQCWQSWHYASFVNFCFCLVVNNWSFGHQMRPSKSFRQLFFRLQKKSCFFWLFFQIKKTTKVFVNCFPQKFFAQSFLFLITAKTESCYFFFELLTGRLLKKKMRSTWKLVDSWKMLVLRALLFLVLFVLPEVPEFIKFKNSWNTKNHW